MHYSYSILWSMEHTDCGNIIRTCPKNILVIILLCIRNIFLHVLPVSIFVSFFKDFDPVTVGQKFNLADVTASGTRRKMRYLRERFESNWAHHNVAYFELILANLALASAQLLGQIRTKDCPKIIRTIFSGSALIRTGPIFAPIRSRFVLCTLCA